MSLGSSPGENGPEQDKQKLKDIPGLAGFAGLGLSIALCEGAGVLLGLGLDRWWHAAPVGLVVGIVLGTVAAVASVTKLVHRYL